VELSCFEPIPLRPRRRPTAVAPLETVDAKKNETATLFIQDTYAGMKGTERGRVKYVRVMGALPWPWNQNGISWRLGVKADLHRKKIHGIAKIHEDGSRYFTVPAGENPCKANLTREEFTRIVTWIDANVPYYGTYRGKRDLQDKDAPNFRLPPLAGK